MFERGIFRKLCNEQLYTLLFLPNILCKINEYKMDRSCSMQRGHEKHKVLLFLGLSA